MKRIIGLPFILIIISNCCSQPSVAPEAVRLFQRNIYDKACKVYAPDYLIENVFYSYRQNNIYTFNKDKWCSVKLNAKPLPLPKRSIMSRQDFDYRILNDSLSVFFFNDLYSILYFVNIEKGVLVKVDTIVKPAKYEKAVGNKKYTVNQFHFLGGVFSGNKFYFLSVADTKNERSFLLKVNLHNNLADTIRIKFSFENHLTLPKASEHYITVQSGATIDVFNHSILSVPRKIPFDGAYRILDFVSEDIILLHHSEQSHKFALLNLTNGKDKFLQFDQQVFGMENIRQEEILKEYNDGPNDGLNQNKFRYLSCRGNANELLLSFADRKENRLLYSIYFPNEILDKLK